MRLDVAGAPRSADAAAGPVLILAALEEEIASLRGMMAVTRKMKIGRCHVDLGRIGRMPVVLACTGDGAANAARGAAAVLESLPAGRAILTGLAGALTPSLEAGRVIAAVEVIEGARRAPAPDAEWLGRVLRDTGATPATFVSSPAILSTAAAKAEARACLPDDAVAVVDLETATWARAVGNRGIPYVALRAVSDTFDESLPLDFNALRGADGGVDRGRVALRALGRPWLVAPLWRLRGRARFCSDNLARAVRALVAGGAS